jgi:hypothetical protein
MLTSNSLRHVLLEYLVLEQTLYLHMLQREVMVLYS